MAIVREFSSLVEFLKHLDAEISEGRRILGEMLKRLEEVRAKAEAEKRVRTIFSKLGLPEGPAQNEVALKNVKIIVNPTASQELAALESAVEALNNRIMTLTAVRKEVDILSGLEAEVKITAIYVDNVPRVLIIRLSPS